MSKWAVFAFEMPCLGAFTIICRNTGVYRDGEGNEFGESQRLVLLGIHGTHVGKKNLLKC